MLKGNKKVKLSSLNKLGKRKMLIVIIAMLVMCLFAVICIFSLANGDKVKDRSEEIATSDAGTESADGSESEGGITDAEGDDESGGKAGSSETGDKSKNKDTEKKSKGSKHVYSYNGSSDNAPFSFAAYDSAIEAGSGVIILPFVVSADGTAYVSDDDYATNLTGYGGYFSGMTDAQIDAITTKAGGHVLKMTDVFKEYGRDVHYVIEIKYTSGRNISAFRDFVTESGYEDIITAACMYHDTLKSLEVDFPDMPKLYLCQDQAGINVAAGLSHIDIVCANKSVMTKANCKMVHENGKEFGAWTLDSKEDIKAAIDMGVDSYFTNEAETAMKLEKDRS